MTVRFGGKHDPVIELTTTLTTDLHPALTMQVMKQLDEGGDSASGPSRKRRRNKVEYHSGYKSYINRPYHQVPADLDESYMR